MIFRKAVLLTLAVFVFCANTVLTEEIYIDTIDIDKIEDACNSTVVINGDKVNPGVYGGSKESSISFNGVGAGVLVDPRGYIITNYHVIEGIKIIQVKTYDGREYIGQPIRHSLATDIALIKITSAEPFSPIVIGDSSKLRRLHRVVVSGHPFGYQFTTNSGEISGFPREVPVKENLVYHNMIQISAAINPGNSGGPLLTPQGEMIGINSALRQDSNGIAFALPVDFVMEVAADLFQQHTSQFCYHGIRFKEIDVTQIGTSNINIDDYKILAIDTIDPESPANQAGLEPGDVLLQANGMAIERKLDLQRSLIDKKNGDVIQLVFDRAGERYKTEMVLQSPKSRTANTGGIAVGPANKTAANVNQSTQNRQAAPPSNQTRTDNPNSDFVWNVFGIRVSAVTQEEFQRRNAELNSPYIFEGALEVIEIKPGGVFESLRMQKGDFITAIITPKDQWCITRVSDLKYLADRWTPEDMGGREVDVIVVRNKELLKGQIPVNRNLAQLSRNATVR